MMHMTLATKRLYEVESEDFKEVSRVKKLFFEFILEAISP